MSDSDTTIEVHGVEVNAEDFVEAAEEVLEDGSHCKQTGGRAATSGNVVVSCDGYENDPDGYVTNQSTEETAWTGLGTRLEEAREVLETSDLDHDVYVKFEKSDGYGAILPYDADYHVEDCSDSDFTVSWHSEDDVSDLSEWSPEDRISGNDDYDAAAHVSGVEFLSAEDVEERLQ